MAKNTKALSGPAKRKYFREVLLADAGVTPEAAGRLTDKFDAELSHMRVRQHASLKAAIAAPSEAPKAAAVPVAVPSTFDPHAFSLIVVMSKQGAAGLQGRLAEIDNVEHLKALARAQHVAVDATLDCAEALRAAIVVGTAQRIADRRAAAS